MTRWLSVSLNPGRLGSLPHVVITVCCWCAPLTAGADGGRILGVVTYDGAIPHSAVADNAGVKRPLLEIDNSENGGLRHAVVYLKLPRDRGPAKAAGKPAGGGKPAPPRVTVDQKEYQFTPRVVAVRSGEGVKFTNSDIANHNVHGHGLDSKNQFNVFTGGGTSHVHRFRAEKGDRPVRIGCDIHPWMRGWVYVFDHPYFAVTSATGEFTLDDLPAGRHVLAVRQPDGGLERDLDVEFKADSPLEIRVQFTADDVTLRDE